MLIKAVCKAHPNTAVFLLHGTTSYYKVTDTGDRRFVYEDTERAVFVELDEMGLHCTAGNSVDVGEHETCFEIVLQSSFDEDGKYIDVNDI